MTRKTVRIEHTEARDGGSIDLDREDVRLADGTRLTEARAEELAQEVLRTVGRGRPSLSAPGRRSPQLRLAIPEQVRAELQARAAAEHRSISDIAREALDRYLAS
jgi:plasmid stability protein